MTCLTSSSRRWVSDLRRSDNTVGVVHFGLVKLKCVQPPCLSSAMQPALHYFDKTPSSLDFGSSNFCRTVNSISVGVMLCRRNEFLRRF